MSQDQENKFRVHRGRLVPDESSSDGNLEGRMARARGERPVDGHIPSRSQQRAGRQNIFQRLGLRGDRNRSHNGLGPSGDQQPNINGDIIPRVPRRDSLATDRLLDPAGVRRGDVARVVRPESGRIGDGRSHTSLTFHSGPVPAGERLQGVGDATPAADATPDPRAPQVGDTVVSDGVTVGRIRGIRADSLDIVYLDDEVPVVINDDGSISPVDGEPQHIRWNPNTDGWETPSATPHRWVPIQEVNLVTAFIDPPAPEIIHDPVDSIRTNEITGDLEARDRAGIWRVIRPVEPGDPMTEQPEAQPGTYRFHVVTGRWEVADTFGVWTSIVSFEMRESHIAPPDPTDQHLSFRRNDASHRDEIMGLDQVWHEIRYVNTAHPEQSGQRQGSAEFAQSIGRVGANMPPGASVRVPANAAPSPGVMGDNGLPASLPTSTDGQILADTAWCVGVAQQSLGHYMTDDDPRSHAARMTCDVVSNHLSGSTGSAGIGEFSWSLGMLETTLRHYARRFTDEESVTQEEYAYQSRNALGRIAERMTPLYVLTADGPTALSRQMRADIMGARVNADTPDVIHERNERELQEVMRVQGRLSES